MSRFFINRPIVAMVISILMTIIGLVAMSGLPTAQFPNIVPPEIKVTSTYTGADALTVEQAVSTPIEQQMSGVDNMSYMYSINANNGQSTLTINFELGTDANTDQLLAQMRQGQAEDDGGQAEGEFEQRHAAPLACGASLHRRRARTRVAEWP